MEINTTSVGHKKSDRNRNIIFKGRKKENLNMIFTDIENQRSQEPPQKLPTVPSASLVLVFEETYNCETVDLIMMDVIKDSITNVRYTVFDVIYPKILNFSEVSF